MTAQSAVAAVVAGVAAAAASTAVTGEQSVALGAVRRMVCAAEGDFA